MYRLIETVHVYANKIVNLLTSEVSHLDLRPASSLWHSIIQRCPSVRSLYCVMSYVMSSEDVLGQ